MKKATSRPPVIVVIAFALALNRSVSLGRLSGLGLTGVPTSGFLPALSCVLRGSLQDHQLIQWRNDSHNFCSDARGTVTGTSRPIMLVETTTSPCPLLLGVTTMAFHS